MGDRTYTRITLTKQEYTAVEKEFGGKEKIEELWGLSYICDSTSAPNCISLIDDEANYGQIEPLENILHEREIEYDKFWGPGNEFTEGNEYARNVDGIYKVMSIYIEQEATLTMLKALTKIEDTIALKLEINNKIAELEPFEITPLYIPNSAKFIKDS